MNHDTLSKTAKASLSQKEFENIKTSRMYSYEKPNAKDCPVASIEDYPNKIPPTNNFLFPLPLQRITNKSNFWYVPRRNMGKDSLGNMMRSISEKAELSQMYSNHCVRVTTVSILHEKGFSADQISSVTGHKSTQSVTNYIGSRRDAEKNCQWRSMMLTMMSSQKQRIWT